MITGELKSRIDREYMLGKIASAGQNGQFRTPRHIIRLMVEMTAPTPKDLICDPACGTAGFLIAASEHLRAHHAEAIYRSAASRRHFNESDLPDILGRWQDRAAETERKRTDSRTRTSARWTWSCACSTTSSAAPTTTRPSA